MGGYTRDQKMSLRLIALIAMRRAKAEHARKSSHASTPDIEKAVQAKPKRFRWFG